MREGAHTQTRQQCAIFLDLTRRVSGGRVALRCTNTERVSF
jgi:hypothetical protein